jgi:CheY-like chemotaxis protein
MPIAPLMYHTCLLIDNNYIDNFIHIRLLQRSNFAKNIIASQDAREVIKFLQDGTIKPDIIFLDIQMPLMDGFEFLKEYDKININKELVKIILLTSSIDPTDIKRAEKNKYITKLVTKPLTDKVIKNLIYDHR